MDKERKSKLAEKLTTLIFYLSIILFFIAFNFQDSRNGGWYQQFLPSLPGSPPLLDITFADSTVGYAVTDKTGDTSYVLKTTNGGDNWFVNLKRTDGLRSYKVQCLSKDTVYFGAYFSIYKSVNGGLNWSTINIPGGSYVYDLFVLNKDTIWYSGGTFTSGGLWRTTNSGATWDLQYGGGSNVDRIYMYNARIGFMGINGNLFKTINGGFNWTQIIGESDYTDILFIDSLIGYKAKYGIKKTTNGGIDWQVQFLPNVIEGSYTDNYINKFSKINDTIYGVLGSVWFQIGNRWRAIVYKTTNSGFIWGYQLPDTSYQLPNLYFTKFIDNKVGWCYRPNRGIRTLSGGDSTIYMGINQNNNMVSTDYKLFQNYPNPYNQCTIINVQLSIAKIVKLDVYDITGKLIKTIVDKKENTGLHSYKFDGVNLSSGVYFYTLFVDGVRVDTKKMALIK